MLPSEYREVQGYPHLKKLLAEHIDMQFQDLRVLLTLPRRGSHVGGNFAAAALLFNVISGASVAFYNTSAKALKGKAGGNGERFQAVITNHFPLTEIGLPTKTVLKVFYNWSRNPLTHSLGLAGPKDVQVLIAKRRLTPNRITELEDSETLPKWSREALFQTGPGRSYQIGISGLYWGVHRMLHSIFSDAGQAKKADEVAERLGF